jgi:hypothetical protein
LSTFGLADFGLKNPVEDKTANENIFEDKDKTLPVIFTYLKW